MAIIYQGDRFRDLARIFLKDPSILILDEATSAVDTETEWKIWRALEGLPGKRTIIIITHRLPTVVNADLILVFDNGDVKSSIVERGTHNELLACKGKYYRMWKLQSRQV